MEQDSCELAEEQCSNENANECQAQALPENRQHKAPIRVQTAGEKDEGKCPLCDPGFLGGGLQDAVQHPNILGVTRHPDFLFVAGSVLGKSFTEYLNPRHNDCEHTASNSRKEHDFQNAESYRDELVYHWQGRTPSKG